jgi:hypothetical protein
LYLEALAVHEGDETDDELRLALSELLPVRAVDRDVAESRGAVVLHVGVRRVQEADKDGDGTSVDQLLPVLVYRARRSGPSSHCRERMTCQSVSCSKEHRWRSVVHACPSTWPDG